MVEIKRGIGIGGVLFVWLFAYGIGLGDGGGHF